MAKNKNQNRQRARAHQQRQSPALEDQDPRSTLAEEQMMPAVTRTPRRQHKRFGHN